jgi:TRAP-type mannitol/chloroaromatic compound transport system permease small subunit
VHAAYIHHEISPDPGGLHHRWIIKAAIPLGFALLAVQGVSSIIKNLLFLLDKPR